jgi:serine/threonine protein kinase
MVWRSRAILLPEPELITNSLEICDRCRLTKGLTRFTTTSKGDGLQLLISAASVRHPNVASVFYLGRTGQNYFYAMEFVEGETLENLIKRSGRLEVKLALEIATQVATGLAGVYKQKLVHRDIKPSNIMVSLEEGGALTAKIIDLGLAKPAPDAPAETAISTPGAFVGTPDFASPEQFSGIPRLLRR